MIGWGDAYKVVVAMVPLYVALGLGYLSVKWWRMFKPDQCNGINRLNCYFISPFFTFHFIAAIDPYHMNYRFLAGDVVAKTIVAVVLVLWVKLSRKGSFSWAITSFSLSSFNNTLVVGVPLLEAMYGALGKDLVVQSSVIQALIWFPLLLFLLEFRRAISFLTDDDCNNRNDFELGQPQIVAAEVGVDDKMNAGMKLERTTSLSSSLPTPSSPSYNLGSTTNKVLAKLAKNPNCYACVIGIIWSLLAKRWNLEMPSIVEGSLTIMSQAGSGVAMFSMGLFMALQEKVIACGIRVTMYGMILRFVIGPLTMVVGSLALGLRSNILIIAIMQAALPQSISSFVFAQEYDLNANVLSTAVIFGTVISLPLLIGYYGALGVVN